MFQQDQFMQAKALANANNVREIREGASNRAPITSPNHLQKFISKSLSLTGNLVTLGNRHNLSPVKLRRVGAAALTAVSLVPAATFGRQVGESFFSGVDYATNTNIPTTESPLPTGDELKQVPSTGAFGMAEQYDPNHDPRNGMIAMSEQLGHDAQPGDTVAVPIPKPNK